jgi:hypothetical protein
VPPAAQVAFSASQGPRVVPGTYTVRITDGPQVVETKLAVNLDARAPFSVADRKAHFDAMMKAHALFGEMSDLVERIETARRAAEARAKSLPAGDELGGKLKTLVGKLIETRRKIVATKEGGAITGEERIREHLDNLYGALQGWEGRPAPYKVERIEVLRRELSDVGKEFEGIATQDVKALNEELGRKNLEPIPTKKPAGERAESEPSGGAGWFPAEEDESFEQDRR